MSLTLRNIKGSPLTYTEMDNNLTYLEGLTTGSTASDLATVLATGNETDGNDIVMSDGDKIFNTDGVDLTSGLELDPANNNNGTRLYTEDTNSGDMTSLDFFGVIGVGLTTYTNDFALEFFSFLDTGTLANDTLQSYYSLTNYNGSGQASMFQQVDLVTDESLISLSADEITINSLKVVLPSIPIYANNADAIAGGLTTDMIYKTSGGELRIVV
jgi:hypothetical protein